MAVFKCKMCGGTIDFQPGDTVGVCEYCGTKQTLPKIDDERKANLYERANHFRRANDFDRAMAIYEQILDEDISDAEAYWSLVLCRYGIEYVEDPTTHKRVPTVNRVQYTSIFADEDYKAALSHADTYQQVIYEEEAKAIDEIQKGILAISEKEEPFDIFICYKETDNNGRRTEDSVLAYDIYKELTKEGYKVFFSRVTLEDKLGTAYEPYIFAALNSSKIMIAVGTKAEFYNAVWVKNEWSRYLALIKKGAKKTLIPAYKGIDPYDLPEEFSHLQGQDMAKLGFMQDLVRGVKKILGESEVRKITDAEIAPLIDKANEFLEKKDWESAKEYFERALDIDARNVKGNLGVLLADMKVTKEDELSGGASAFDTTDSYKKAIRYADEALVNRLKGYNEEIRKRIAEKKKKGIKLGITCVSIIAVIIGSVFVANYIKNTVIPQRKYQQAINAYENQEYEEALKILEEIEGFEGTKELKNNIIDMQKSIIYQQAIEAKDAEDYQTAYTLLCQIRGYKDVSTLITICDKHIKEEAEQEEKYQNALSCIDNKDYEQAWMLLSDIKTYKDSVQLLDEIEELTPIVHAEKLMSLSQFKEAYDYLDPICEGYSELKELKEICYRCKICSGVFSDERYRIESKFIYQDGEIFWAPSSLNDHKFLSVSIYTGFLNPTSVTTENARFFRIIDSIFEVNFTYVNQKVTLTVRQEGNTHPFITLTKED